MANEHLKAQLSELLDHLDGHFQTVGALARRRGAFTPSGSAADGLVTVVTNSDGMVVETRFAPGVEKLTYDEIAASVVAAAKSARAEAARHDRELADTLRARRPPLPTLSELVPGFIDPRDGIAAPEQLRQERLRQFEPRPDDR